MNYLVTAYSKETGIETWSDSWFFDSSDDAKRLAKLEQDETEWVEVIEVGTWKTVYNGKQN